MTADPSTRPPLDPSRLQAPPGWWVEVVEESPSTNAAVAERAREGEDAGLVVVAEHQTAGRGRLDRSWETPARSALTFSVLLRPGLPPQQWPWLPLLTGYAVQAALADRLPQIGLKWPNDVLVEERKLAGILVERVETPLGPAAVVGCGVNVSHTLEELPVALATSIQLELGGPAPDRTDLLGQVLGSLHALQGLTDDLGALRAAYTDVCTTLGREVDVHLPSRPEPVRGTAREIGPGGTLVVDGPDGRLEVGAGDVVHVRPV